jgi:hypothetical protein
MPCPYVAGRGDCQVARRAAFLAAALSGPNIRSTLRSRVENPAYCVFWSAEVSVGPTGSPSYHHGVTGAASSADVLLVAPSAGAFLLRARGGALSI